MTDQPAHPLPATATETGDVTPGPPTPAVAAISSPPAVEAPAPVSPPAAAFDGAGRFIRVSGNPYLPVQARIDWFRTACPEGTIEQELVRLESDFAIFKSRVTRVEDGVVRGWADGFGHEFAKDFPDYVLKAATVSLGRALNALGFGGNDLLEGVDEGNLADAPLGDAGGRLARPQGGGERGLAAAQPATPRQLKFVEAIARERGLAPEALAERVRERFGEGSTLWLLTKAQVSDLIDHLQEGRPEGSTGDRRPSRGEGPTPFPGAREAWKRANGRYHAVGDELGFSDQALHLLAVSTFPERPDGPTTSRRQLTAAELADLARHLEAQAPRLPDGSTHPRTDYANRIAAAAVPGSLTGVSNQMHAAGVLDEWLVRMGRYAKVRLTTGGGAPYAPRDDGGPRHPEDFA